MNNEQPFGNYNTLDYAMHRHDIYHIKATRNIGQANLDMYEGWVLLWIGNDGDGDLNYILGQPRPKYCKGHFDSDHGHSAPELKQWDHNREEWVCRTCLEHEAYRDNEDIDNPGSPF